MSAIVIAVLALAAFALSLHPLFREERPTYSSERGINLDLENLLSAREATYSAIKDLESDYAQGKLSDADYQTLRAKYETKALRILQQLDQIETRASASAQQTPAARGACARCGKPVSAQDRFCRHCGAGVTPACASCGAPLRAGAQFCALCGAPVTALQPA